MIAARLQSATAKPPLSAADRQGQTRVEGFRALQAGQIDRAEQAFTSALAAAPDDAEALGGLGLTRLRQGRTEEGRSLLARAMAADPAHRDRWQAAYDGSARGAEIASAGALLSRGDAAGAERALLALRRSGSFDTGMLLMLAQAEQKLGRPQAEADYRAVLARQPGNGAAAIGLADLLAKSGRTDEALALLDRVQPQGGGKLAAALRERRFLVAATDVKPAAARVALLSQAVAANPADPWARLELARAQRSAGDAAGARDTMQPVIEGHLTGDAAQAAFLYARETHDDALAETLAARLPRHSRVPEIERSVAQLKLDRALEDAAAMPDAPERRRRLLEIAAGRDPTGARGAAAAHAFAARGDREDAAAAIAAATASNRPLRPEARLEFAGALLEASEPEAASRLLAGLDLTALTPEQREAAEKLRNGLAIREADQLREQGRVADAYDRLQPALDSASDDPAPQMALARLYQAANRPGEGLKIVEQALARNPDDPALRRQAVGVAIAAGRLGEAADLVAEGIRRAPESPETWLAAADLAERQGHKRAALEDLRKARMLRLQQTGAEPIAPAATPAIFGASYINPFRPEGGASAEPISTAEPSAPTDPETQDIDKRIAALQAEAAPAVQAGVYLRSRSGSAGLDQLTEAAVPLEAQVSPGTGTIKFLLRPTYITAGSLGSGLANTQKYGTLVFGGASPGDLHASGVGLGASWELPWATLAVGTTPLGFLVTNVTGKLELAPHLGPDWTLRLTGERVAVTDSVTSYAGSTDPRTGQSWGGVVRNHGHAQIEYATNRVNLYLGGGYAVLTGRAVPDDHAWDMGAGGSTELWRDPSGGTLRGGLDLVAFGYQRNERAFTLGQGGYFSPSHYYAALIPLTYRETDDALTWSVGGAVGYQTYREASAPVFPTNPGDQAGIAAFAAASPSTVSATVPSRSQSGVSGNAHADVRYRIETGLEIGGEASYQRAGDWNEASGTIYARYVFGGE